MQEEFWKKIQLEFFNQKMGVALPRLSGWPKIVEVLLGYKLLDAREIFIPNFNFCQKMGVALPRPSGWLKCYLVQRTF